MSKFSLDLKDKTVVITGAGGVICGAIAEELALSGAKLALLDINGEAADAVAKRIAQKGGIAKAYATNVLDKSSLIATEQMISSELGSVDIVINGAGGNNSRATTEAEYCIPHKTEGKDFFSLNDDGVRFVFDLNFLGTFLTTQVFAKDMVAKGGGTVLNISSMNAFTPLTKIPAYSGAKAAVSNFTQWLSVHLARANIRVNAIAPGFFVTKQNKDLLYAPDGAPTPRTGKILAATPMGRFGKVEELMGAVKLLLNDDEAAFITGVVLPIDGGFSAYSGV